MLKMGKMCVPGETRTFHAQARMADAPKRKIPTVAYSIAGPSVTLGPRSSRQRQYSFFIEQAFSWSASEFVYWPSVL